MFGWISSSSSILCDLAELASNLLYYLYGRNLLGNLLSFVDFDKWIDAHLLKVVIIHLRI